MERRSHANNQNERSLGESAMHQQAVAGNMITRVKEAHVKPREA